jgi:hypothetical protein
MNKKTIERENALIIDNAPRYVRCYDNGGESIDRFTIVFSKKKIYQDKNSSDFFARAGVFGYVASSSNPFHPQGYYMHCESGHRMLDEGGYKHLGKKVKFLTLPGDVQRAVIDDYCDLWDISETKKQEVLKQVKDNDN